MSDCCSSSGCNAKHPNKLRCPVNGVEYSEVSTRTIAHHVKESWAWSPSAEHYYFCEDPDCDVAYFGDDGSVVSKSRLRTIIGAKEWTGDALLCHLLQLADALGCMDDFSKLFPARTAMTIDEFVAPVRKRGRK